MNDILSLAEKNQWYWQGQSKSRQVRKQKVLIATN